MDKLYSVIDTQAGYFMEDTLDKPMTELELRERFWCLDDSRSNTFKQFTLDYIMEAWQLKIVEYDSKEAKEYKGD